MTNIIDYTNLVKEKLTIFKYVKVTTKDYKGERNQHIITYKDDILDSCIYIANKIGDGHEVIDIISYN